MADTTTKQRYDFVDLMKGVTIILVIALHCLITYTPKIDAMLFHTRMPLYTFLAGLFFSTMPSFKVQFVKKINRYILPLLLFSFIYALIFNCTISYFSIPLLKGEIVSFFVYQSQMRANSPLWFLRYLMMLFLLCYCFEFITRKCSKTVKIILAFAISCSYFYFNQTIHDNYHGGINNLTTLYFNTNIPSALVAFPTYYLPYLFKDYILRNHNIKHLTIALPFAFAAWYFASQSNMDSFFKVGNCGTNYLRFIIAQAGGLYVFFYFCYLIKRIPFISYLGRYSIVLLCTHAIMLYLCRHVFFISDPYMKFALIIATAPLLIWVLTKYLPHFTAQKDLIKVDENGKIRISFRD